MKKMISITCCLLVLFLYSAAGAGAPMDAVQANVGKVLEILRDPMLKSPSAREVKIGKLRAVYQDMFEQTELSRRALARNWSRLSQDQQREFVGLFQQVLEKAYIDKILSYADQKVIFSREVPISENHFEVQTRIVAASKEIPISYRVILKGNTWKVYDVVVENVSLVLNYRTQFNEILAKETPERLLAILREKVGTQ
jgi:phospholipid transport system substrate-binding protein